MTIQVPRSLFDILVAYKSLQGYDAPSAPNLSLTLSGEYGSYVVEPLADIEYTEEQNVLTRVYVDAD